MRSVPLIPTVTPGDSRRRFPWKDGSTVPYTELWPEKVEGDRITGFVRVPTSLCFTEQHTNERIAFDNFLKEHLQRWVEWRRQRGWKFNGGLQVSPPEDPPTAGNAKASAFVAQAGEHIGKGRDIRAVVPVEDDVKWVFVSALFTRDEPVYARFSDVEYLNHLGNVYAQDDVKDTGWGDPLVIAEERRKRLGLRRQDYLFEDLRIPY